MADARLRITFEADNRFPSPPPDEPSEYEMVRDAAVELFNPRDDDIAEVAIVIGALRGAAAVIEAVPCTCKEPVEDYDTCGRCRALGRHFNVLVER